jgi:hypothetical protein
MTTTNGIPAVETMQVQALCDLQFQQRLIRQGTVFTIAAGDFRSRQMLVVTDATPARDVTSFQRVWVTPPPPPRPDTCVQRPRGCPRGGLVRMPTPGAHTAGPRRRETATAPCLPPIGVVHVR